MEILKNRLFAENVYLQDEIKLVHNFENIITRSDTFKKVLNSVEQVASTDSTVLILGETGTGKELLARAVHNISDRENPSRVGYYDIQGGHARTVTVSGDYAYVADGTGGLAIIDISDPTDPTPPTFSRTIAGTAEGVAVAGSFAFVATTGGGLAIVDISDPTDASPPVPVYAAANGYGVVVAGSHAYVAAGANGLAVVELWKP